MSVCRRCKATVRWVRMETTGKSMPIDPMPNPLHGTVAARIVGCDPTELAGYVISRNRPLEHGYTLYVAHWDLCNRIGPEDAARTHQPTPLVGARS